MHRTGIEREIRFSLVILLLGFLSLPLKATKKDEKKTDFGWQKKLIGALNFSQNNFDNWVKGGQDSWAWQLDLNAKFVLTRKNFNWVNTGRFRLGRTKVGNVSSRKAADEIKLGSVYTYKLDAYVNPYISMTAQTQVAPGFAFDGNNKTEVSNLFDPIYLIQGLGLGYAPSQTAKTRLGFSLKETITRNHPAPYADNPRTAKIEKIRVEPGLESVTDISRKLSENILYTSKLEMFSNMKGLNRVDVTWNNFFSAKVSRYIAVSFNFKLFYDRDISTKRQLQQTLAAGLTYSFL